MRDHTVREGVLTAVDHGGSEDPPRGSLHLEDLGRSRQDLTVRVNGVSLPDGSLLELFRENALLGSFEVKRGRGRLRLDSRDLAAFTSIEHRDTFEVRHRGRVLLRGQLLRAVRR